MYGAKSINLLFTWATHHLTPTSLQTQYPANPPSTSEQCHLFGCKGTCKEGGLGKLAKP